VPVGSPNNDSSHLTTSVAILAPRGRDAAVASQLLNNAGISTITAKDLENLTALIGSCIAVVLLTEEALSEGDVEPLTSMIEAQPSWSDIPFIVLANQSAGQRSSRAMARIDTLKNATLLSRPLHAEELVRAVKSALTARARQHEARQHLQKLEMRESQLEESEAKFRAIADSVDQMIWSTLPDGFHDYYNRRWYEFTGVPEGSTDGEAWNGMFHPDDQDDAWAAWRKSLKTGMPYEIEYRLRHHSGVYRWVLGRAQPMRDTSGVIQRWYGSCTDIHEIKMSQRPIRNWLSEFSRL
jgi:PAS domain S-box-containing protein